MKKIIYFMIVGIISVSIIGCGSTSKEKEDELVETNQENVTDDVKNINQSNLSKESIQIIDNNILKIHEVIDKNTGAERLKQLMYRCEEFKSDLENIRIKTEANGGLTEFDESKLNNFEIECNNYIKPIKKDVDEYGYTEEVADFHQSEVLILKMALKKDWNNLDN